MREDTTIPFRNPALREGSGAGRRFRSGLLAFYDYPASHWRSLRTTNPVESTFATIRLRTAKSRYCLSEKTALSLVHQLAMSDEKRWRLLRGLRHPAEVIADVRFIDGVKEKESRARCAPSRRFPSPSPPFGSGY